MKIERISPNKLKITISSDDLHELNVSIDNLIYNPDEAQDLFWQLIKRAEDETGFFADNSQIVVEAVPTKNDGFIMHITKINEQTEVQPQKYAKYKSKMKKRKQSFNPLVFEFENFENVILACNAMSNAFIGQSRLYKYNNLYYLFIYADNEFLAQDLDIMLTEFARKCETPFVKFGQLFEHAKVIIKDNVVENINSYF